MIWINNYYAEELVVDDKVISHSEKYWDTSNLDEYNKNHIQWKELAENKESYDFVEEPFCIGIFVETEQNGHTIVFRRGHLYSIKSDD